MKLISWNVNGLRACCDKGFRDAFKTLDADFSACKKLKCRKGNSIFPSTVIPHTGTTPRKRIFRNRHIYPPPTFGRDVWFGNR